MARLGSFELRNFRSYRGATLNSGTLTFLVGPANMRQGVITLIEAAANAFVACSRSKAGGCVSGSSGSGNVDPWPADSSRP